MQFYFAVAAAIFFIFLVEADREPYSCAKDWAIDLSKRFIISLFWPLIIIGLAIKTHNDLPSKPTTTSKGTNQ